MTRNADMEPLAHAHVRILVVDDHAVVRIGLKTLLELEPGFTIVAEAGTNEEAVRLARHTRPDVVLMDIRLPDGSGIDACRAIRKHSGSTRVLFLTSYSDAGTVQEALRSGANGYLLKEADADYLIEAIRTVARGDSLLGTSITSQVLECIRGAAMEGSPPASTALADIERRMLSLIAEGKTNREIADQLQLSLEDARNYLTSIYRKLEI